MAMDDAKKNLDRQIKTPAKPVDEIVNNLNNEEFIDLGNIPSRHRNLQTGEW